MKKNKITEIDGWGTLHGARTASDVDVKDKDGDTTSYTFDNLIIATGAHGPAAARHRAQRATS